MTKYSNHVECSEAIVAILVRNVPAPWRLIEVQAKLDHGVEMVTTECSYYPPPRGSEQDWFGIEDAHENVEFTRCFLELAHLTSTPELGLLKRCKFALEADGNYRTKYEY